MISRVTAAFEGLDDDHATAAGGARLGEDLRFGGIGIGGSIGLRCELWNSERRADRGNVVCPTCVGEQAVMADAMEAARQHVHQEAPDELVGGKCHCLHASACVDPIVFVFEGDTL